MGQCMRVVQATQAAKEQAAEEGGGGGRLDLSDCQLMQMPDAVYHLMRDTPLVAASLANNVISKIPPKLPLSFNLLTELDLSNNRISALPVEMSACKQLETINISTNSFVHLPPVLLELPAIAAIKAGKNFIADVDVEAVVGCSSLEQLNLEENPLNPDTHIQLQDIQNIRIVITPREREEWEDLSI